MSNSIRDNWPSSVTSTTEVLKYKTLYDDITDNGVILQYHDRHMLAELAVSMVEMDRLRKELLKNGEWVECQGDRNQIMKKNPARDALEKIRPVVLRIMKEFKMSPGSRGGRQGVQVGVENPGDNSDGFNDI